MPSCANHLERLANHRGHTGIKQNTLISKKLSHWCRETKKQAKTVAMFHELYWKQVNWITISTPDIPTTTSNIYWAVGKDRANLIRFVFSKVL